MIDFRLFSQHGWNSLEVFRLIWFDLNFTIFDDPQLDERLCLIINHLTIFSAIEECQEYFEQNQ